VWISRRASVCKFVEGGKFMMKEIVKTQNSVFDFEAPVVKKKISKCQKVSNQNHVSRLKREKDKFKVLILAKKL